ncbi:MAG: DUF5103 domain-containing protein [Bacteroidaceae bacterium]|nr:DUF5103 domain-containing protein [Bacteroidaceae bacterium]
MKIFAHFIAIFCLCASAQAQEQRTFSQDIRSLQLLVNDNPLRAPILERGEHVAIEFDELSHDYHRYVYHIQHCNADWTETEGLFESDFLAGFNDQPIEDYENSFNTTQLYTHYRLVLPNEETGLRLSGNYRVQIFEDDDREEPLLQAEFCIADPSMSIMAELSGNTDIDFNQSHQQLSYTISYGPHRVIDPMRELHTVVMQNRRQDTKVVGLRPNIQKSNGVEFTHRRELIFPAGNEFHKFEILDVQKPGMNVDYMRWYEPYYHATLYADTPARNYVYDEDQNGAFVMRNNDDEGDDVTTSEYLWVHFSLRTPRLNGPLYLYGQWANGFPDERCLMTYDDEAKAYRASVYLKQGYYNYMYLGENGTTPDGNFYETENEYIILVYYRPQGGRYDQLVGYRVMKSN